MIQIRCSVYDKATQLYSRPFYCATATQAIRTFSDECKRVAEDNQFNKHPSDYTLFELGTWDDEAGVTADHHTPKLLITATAAQAA